MICGHWTSSLVLVVGVTGFDSYWQGRIRRHQKKIKNWRKQRSRSKTITVILSNHHPQLPSPTKTKNYVSTKTSIWNPKTHFGLQDYWIFRFFTITDHWCDFPVLRLNVFFSFPFIALHKHDVWAGPHIRDSQQYYGN